MTKQSKSIFPVKLIQTTKQNFRFAGRYKNNPDGSKTYTTPTSHCILRNIKMQPL